MNTDGILKLLRKEDLPESMDLFIDIFSGLDIKLEEHEKYFNNDGLDLMRYLIKNLDGISISPPQVKFIKPLMLRYIENRLKEKPGMPLNRLCHETGLCEKSVREYLKELNFDSN